jgi:hypothetical protein
MRHLHFSGPATVAEIVSDTKDLNVAGGPGARLLQKTSLSP